MLRVVSIPENFIERLAQKYSAHVILILPDAFQPQQFFDNYINDQQRILEERGLEFNPEYIDNEFIGGLLEQHTREFLSSVECLQYQICYCNYCKRQMVPSEVAEHVRSSAHIVAKDEADNIPSHGCPITLHGRPMLLDHHVIFVETMFGKNVLLYDDTIGAIVLPDITLGVQLCPGHEYSLVKFFMERKTKRLEDTIPPAMNTLPTDTAQNRYYTKDFVEVSKAKGGSKFHGPRDSRIRRSRDRNFVCRFLGLTDGDDLPNSRNVAVAKKMLRLKKNAKLMLTQIVRNRAMKIQEHEDTTLLRTPKQGQTRVAGVLPLVDVERQDFRLRHRNSKVRNRLIHKLARVALMEARREKKMKERFH